VIILDTNVLSEPLRPSPDERVVEWLDAQIVETLFLTTVTLAEVRYGIAALPSGKRRTGLAERFEAELLPLFAGRILPFDEPATLEYAALRGQARAAGLAIGDFDALIASIARAHRFGVATRDVAPFESAGVASVIDPFGTRQ
jgi:predicted nucleic acid-binding protein